jgi:hypothetical protein
MYEGEAADGPSIDTVLTMLRQCLGPAHPMVARVAAANRGVVEVEPPSA